MGKGLAQSRAARSLCGWNGNRQKVTEEARGEKGPGQVGRQGHSKDPVYTGRFWADAPGRLNNGAI